MPLKELTEVWEHEFGVEFLETIGVNPGVRVLDFGAGSGHYTLPAAKVVGTDGAIVAVDLKYLRLQTIHHKALSQGTDIIYPVLVNGHASLPIREASIDVVLAYDVMHLVEDRELFYQEFWRILRGRGLFSIYPKHCKEDLPMGGLAALTISQIREEIEQYNFRLHSIYRKRLCHDDQLVLGYVLNFRKQPQES